MKISLKNISPGDTLQPKHGSISQAFMINNNFQEDSFVWDTTLLELSGVSLLVIINILTCPGDCSEHSVLTQAWPWLTAQSFSPHMLRSLTLRWCPIKHRNDQTSLIRLAFTRLFGDLTLQPLEQLISYKHADQHKQSYYANRY